jgi:uncharacterized protein YcbK (DUF882 family)
MQINHYFARCEFACPCNCGFDVADDTLVDILTRIRQHFNSPLTITSGCRCKQHNLKVGGAKKSFHVVGKAADIKVENVTAAELYEFLTYFYPDRFGFILYPTWVHVDVRDVMYRGEK